MVTKAQVVDLIRCSRCRQILNPEAFSPSQRRQGAWCRQCANKGPKPRTPSPNLITHGRKPTGTRWRRLQEQVWASETHCGFCGDYVDQTLPHNATMARCVDHIIPITTGGAMYDRTNRTNVRLAHRSCNSKAGHAMGGTERAELLRAALWLSRRL